MQHDMTLTRRIFCEGGPGSILDTVQHAGIFPDSKTFVDMKLNFDPGVVLQSWQTLCSKSPENVPSKEDIRGFVEANFSPETEAELEQWVPGDWVARPRLPGVTSARARQFCTDLNQLWRLLGRRVAGRVRELQPRHTLLHLPRPFVVPGGRFREVYYWDSFWILRGLVVCGMLDTARGMVDNLADLVTRIVEVAALEREWAHWDGEAGHHRVEVRGHTLYRYWAGEDSPRPESYREDVRLAREAGEDPQRRRLLWRELRTAAESGWDFSSRWFRPRPGEGAGAGAGAGVGQLGLQHTAVTSILPVDLNAFLARSAAVLAQLLEDTDPEAAARWRRRQHDLEAAMEALMWDEEAGCWRDLDLDTGLRSQQGFVASNLVPLWTRSFPAHLAETRGRACVGYLRAQLGPGSAGVPCTLERSGQQWDLPNLWPPLEHLVITGLYTSGCQEAREEARRLARARVEHCLNIFQKTGHMFEKYSYDDVSQAGGGGEYEVQVGFGWTNGMLLDIMATIDCF